MPDKTIRQPALVAEGVCKDFVTHEGFWFSPVESHRRVLEGFSLVLHPGDVVGLIGRTGAGKTTAARILGGLCQPDAGQVLFEGQPLYSLTASRWRATRRRLRYVFQNPDASLHRRMTVSEILWDVMPHTAAAGGPSKVSVLRELCDTFLIHPSWLDRYPSELSLGQRRRLALARSLGNRPTYALLDEPFSGIDSIAKRVLWGVFEKLISDNRMAILLVSHDVDSVCRLCNRILVMRNGILVESLDRDNTVGRWRPQHSYTQKLFEYATMMC